MLANEVGMVKVVKEVHLSNAFTLMSVTDARMATLAKEMHSEKAQL